MNIRCCPHVWCQLDCSHELRCTVQKGGVGALRHATGIRVPKRLNILSRVLAIYSRRKASVAQFGAMDGLNVSVKC